MQKKIAIFVFFFLILLAFSQSNGAQAPCPKTTMATDCLRCHLPGNFRVKETPADAHLSYPIPNMRIRIQNGKPAGIYFLRGVDADEAEKFFDYLYLHSVKHAIIEIFSPGGGLLAAQKIVAMIEEFQRSGGVVETKIYGAALSAGFYIFVAGTKGQRLVDPYAELMWHELISLEGIGFVFSTPSDSEERARVLRYLQNRRNVWLATRGKLTKDQIDEKIRKKEFWMSGEDAVRYGFADGFIK